MLSDAQRDAERAEIERYRRMTPQQRIQIAMELTQKARDECRRRIAAENPGLDEEELKLKFIEAQYGTDLAERVREDLRLKSTGVGHSAMCDGT